MIVYSCSSNWLWYGSMVWMVWNDWGWYSNQKQENKKTRKQDRKGMWSIRRNWKEYVNKYVLYSLNCICSLPVKKKKGFFFMSVTVSSYIWSYCPLLQFSSVIFGVIALYYSFHLLYFGVIAFYYSYHLLYLELLPFTTVTK